MTLAPAADDMAHCRPGLSDLGNTEDPVPDARRPRSIRPYERSEERGRATIVAPLRRQGVALSRAWPISTMGVVGGQTRARPVVSGSRGLADGGKLTAPG